MSYHTWYTQSPGSNIWILAVFDKDYAVAERQKIAREDISSKRQKFEYVEIENIEEAPERTTKLPNTTKRSNKRSNKRSI